jgi:hypothetical protein
MTDRLAAITALMTAGCAIAAALAGGGTIVLLAVDSGEQAATAPGELQWSAPAAGGAALLTLAGAAILRRRKSRAAVFKGVALLASVAVSVGGGELICRRQIPAWPARALHGVTPREWLAATSKAGPSDVAVGLNSWGQRDRERTVSRPPAATRIAFIGDSFLEEGAAIPVSVATERRIGRPDVEVVNLGVSATGPDEYYDRLRGVAIPLGATHCCWFVFAGNDFVSPPRTLKSFGGIAAVSPRPSLLTSVGLAGWNHLLTNRYRPVMQAWLSGATLAVEERNRHQMLRRASDAEMRQMLVGAAGLDAAAASRLDSRLEQESARSFFQMVREPDEGKYRSYYLAAALTAAGNDEYAMDPNSDEIAWRWTAQAAESCRARNIGFTVVVIPEAFQADDRMREQWLPLADMRRVMAPCRDAAESFVRRARGASVEVIDLHGELAGTRGTYLNLDGHWSAEGVSRVSELLADRLTGTTAASGVPKHEQP